jgi:LmbE family N-acetylglucosaminyl deacetylase
MKFNTVLAIGAHPDDIEFSCFGLLQKVQPEVIHQVVCTSGEIFSDKGKSRLIEQQKACQLLNSELHWLDFPHGKLVADIELIGQLDKILAQVQPDLVLCHGREDHNQDHQAVYNATRASLRHSGATLITFGSWNTRFKTDFNLVVKPNKKDKQEILDCFESQKEKWYFKPTEEKFNIEYMSL